MRKPLVLGIAGGTGSGKTTVARKLGDSLPESGYTIIEHDWYYKDNSSLSDKDREAVNYDHPESLDTALLIENLKVLLSGNSVTVPQYDFTTHSRSKNGIYLEPTPLIIVEGILVFVEKELRDLMDIKIFVDTAADIRIIRRIRRDLEHRGRSFASIRNQYYETVRPMHLQFVEPSKRWADIIIPEGGDNKVALELVGARLMRQLEARM